MIGFLQVAVVAGVLSVSPVRAPHDSVVPSAKPVVTDPWFGADKAKHFLISGFSESVVFASLKVVGAKRGHAFAAAAGVTTIVSLGREWRDRRVKNQFSFRDLAWDLAGGLAAYAMLRQTED